MRRPKPKSRERASSGRRGGRAPRNEPTDEARRGRRRRAPARRDAMKLRSGTPRQPFGAVDQNEMRDGSNEERIDSDGPGASAPVSAPRRDAVPPPRKRSRPPDDAEEADTPVDEDLIDTLMNKRGAPASMDKLKDNDNNQVVVFHHLGALAVQQMNATATQGGNRGREFILDTKTQTYVWLRTVDGSSNVDSKCMAYAKMKDAHARRVVKEHGRMAFASLRRTKLRRKVKLAVLIGRGQTRAGGASLAIAKAWAEGLEGVEVLEDLLYWDESVDAKTPYEDRPRREHQLARPPKVNPVELAKCRGGSLVVIDIYRKSGGKGAAARGVLVPAIRALSDADIDLHFAVAAQSVTATLKRSTDSRLVADLRTAMANAVDLELQNDGPSLEISGAMGAGIYLVDGPNGVRIVYGGSNQAYEGPWTDSRQALMDAVEGNNADDAVELADELVRHRATSHDNKGRHGDMPKKLQDMYNKCRKAKNDYRVRDFMRALAYIWSFPGETKAAFIQRLLRLEQGLLDVLFGLFRSAQRCRWTRGSASTRTMITRSPSRRSKAADCKHRGTRSWQLPPQDRGRRRRGAVREPHARGFAAALRDEGHEEVLRRGRGRARAGRRRRRADLCGADVRRRRGRSPGRDAGDEGRRAHPAACCCVRLVRGARFS